MSFCIGTTNALLYRKASEHTLFSEDVGIQRYYSCGSCAMVKLFAYRQRSLKMTNSVNKKQTSKQVASIAACTMRDPNASSIQKSLAGSVLSQMSTSNQTGAEMEAKASRALKSSRSSDLTKTLAGSVVSQSNKGR